MPLDSVPEITAVRGTPACDPFADVPTCGHDDDVHVMCDGVLRCRRCAARVIADAIRDDVPASVRPAAKGAA